MNNKIENVNRKFKLNYFPQVGNINIDNIKVTTEGTFSISSINSAQILINKLKKIFKTNQITITDATGNNGSDTIKLALEFKNINSIELNKLNYKVLKNNVNEYKLNNVNLYHGDSLEIIPKLTQDVIYIDAPWGGINYKEKSSLSLYLGDKELSDIYNEFRDKAKLFVFKVPINYNFNHFFNTTYVSKYNIYLYTKDNVKKFYFIFVPT